MLYARYVIIKNSVTWSNKSYKMQRGVKLLKKKIESFQNVFFLHLESNQLALRSGWKYEIRLATCNL